MHTEKPTRLLSYVDDEEVQMNALYLRQAVVIVLALSLLLTIGTVGLGVGILRGDVQAPNLDISLGGFQIAASTTNPIECQSSLACQGSSRYYCVDWGFRETAPNYVHLSWHRILSVPLQQ
jgi:hypothetical protein